MDRNIVYPGAIPLDTDILSIQRNTMIALGSLAQAAFGTGTIVDGLAISQTTVASMVVNVGAGSLVSLSTVDATPFGSLPADNTDSLVKVGVNLTATQFTLTAPVSSGQSINYLIEASFAEADGTAVVLPYYNASNPSVAYSGPANSGTAQNTVRTQRVQLQLKPGSPATTGTQTTPAVDSGWVGIYAITVNYGQTSVTTANLASGNPYGAAVIPSAPFIPAKLGPSLVPGFSNAVKFTSNTTWTAPAGITRVKARGWGGGAGGGGANGAGSAAAGASGGGYFEGVYTVVPGTSYAITVGAGGAGGTGSGNGTTGGATSFASFATANGGTGGAGTSGTVQTATVTGGTATGGMLNITGNGGGGAISLGGSAYLQGNGGGTFSTSNAAIGVSISSQTGNGGIFPGGGGNGGTVGGGGGAGGAGLLILEY